MIKKRIKKFSFFFKVNNKFIVKQKTSNNEYFCHQAFFFHTFVVNNTFCAGWSYAYIWNVLYYYIIHLCTFIMSHTCSEWIYTLQLPYCQEAPFTVCFYGVKYTRLSHLASLTKWQSDSSRIKQVSLQSTYHSWLSNHLFLVFPTCFCTVVYYRFVRNKNNLNVNSGVFLFPDHCINVALFERIQWFINRMCMLIISNFSFLR